jgi:hypothetical protein
MHGSGRYTAVGGIRQWEVYGSGRHAWQWEACMAVGGMHSSRRHAWQWEVYGSERMGKKGHLSRTVFIA